MCFGIYSSSTVLHQVVKEELQDISCHGSGGVWVYGYGHLHYQDYEQDGNGFWGTGAMWLIFICTYIRGCMGWCTAKNARERRHLIGCDEDIEAMQFIEHDYTMQ